MKETCYTRPIPLEVNEETILGWKNKMCNLFSRQGLGIDTGRDLSRKCSDLAAMPPATCTHPKARRQEAACLKHISPGVCHPGRRPDTEEPSVCRVRGPGLWEKPEREDGRVPLEGATEDGRQLMQTMSTYPTLASGTQQGPVHTRGCWEEKAGPLRTLG